MAEIVQDILIRFVVGDQDFVSIGEGPGGALQLLGGHLGVPSSADEDLAHSHGRVKVEVRLYVLVHYVHDLRECLDGVPPEGFAAEGGHELPLTLHAVEVGPRSTSVSGEDQGLVPVQSLDVFAHTKLLGELAFSHVDPDPAHGVDDPLETLEIYGGVMVYGQARVVLYGR